MTYVEDDTQVFLQQRAESIQRSGQDLQAQQLSQQWFKKATDLKYSYNFDWLGLPIIQFPQDVMAFQEIIWKTKPEFIIETGIARGGSLILSASMLHLLNQNGKVIGIDIDIRPHNREAIANHPLAFRIDMIEASSIDVQTIEQVTAKIPQNARTMVILDSNHTHEHVLQELKLYSKFVSKDCYLVVMDTCINEMPKDYYANRPWNQGNNPATAVKEFLLDAQEFIIDESIQNKLLVTSARNGFLRRVK